MYAMPPFWRLAREIANSMPPPGRYMASDMAAEAPKAPTEHRYQQLWCYLTIKSSSWEVTAMAALESKITISAVIVS